MGLLDFFRGVNINDGVNQYRDTPGAVLLDVREKDEYNNGHIPESKNLPLSTIKDAAKLIRDYDTPIFVYCLSGARSSQATSYLTRMGYNTVTNIGGIMSYKGELK